MSSKTSTTGTQDVEFPNNGEFDDPILMAAVNDAVETGFPAEKCVVLYEMMGEIITNQPSDVEAVLEIVGDLRKDYASREQNNDGLDSYAQGALSALDFIEDNAHAFVLNGEKGELMMEDSERIVSAQAHLANMFGYIEGIPVGHQLGKRMDVVETSLHRKPQGSVHGKAKLGCYSILISGGYFEDTDIDGAIWFTGVGGSFGEKTSEYFLSYLRIYRENRSLVKSFETGQPIRLIIGSKSNISFRPTDGFMFIGLYRIDEVTENVNVKGNQLLRFRLIPYDDTTRDWAQERLSRVDLLQIRRVPNTSPA
ncbi:hypothetical protein ABW20_dc0103870 [Dactylellina cionopaga]|nr:hypothetical protein ABW20_dc0103870 [Dactylellina cionopaga]